MITGLKKSRTQNAADITANGNVLKGNPFGLLLFKSDPERMNQGSYGENDKMHHPPRVKDIAKTTEQHMSSPYLKFYENRLLRYCFIRCVRVQCHKQRDIRIEMSSEKIFHCANCCDRQWDQSNIKLTELKWLVSVLMWFCKAGLQIY